MRRQFELRLPWHTASFCLDDLGGADHIVGLILRDGVEAYERPLPVLFGALAAGVTGHILDIGANTGLYSILAATLNRTSRVYAFEPLAEVASKLRLNIRANFGAYARVSVHELALSSNGGSAQFFEPVNQFGYVPTSSTLDASFAESQGNCVQRSVNVSTLDSWVDTAQIESIGLIKMDVEAHERAVFDGARHSLATFRPIVVVELLGNADFAYFSQVIAEFEYDDFCPTPALVTRLPAPCFVPEGWNHVFCPRERVAELTRACSALGLPLAV